ncbi:helix-turn-helix transcriptional regulator [Amycolatopsis sp. CA-230715]|uniref:helix-turn-helix transcriptional regulator n=1 Tax=Amycolatopsis sp. CA-230715 TaxID=2745196 RepID=UPI001C02BACD|nr:LuxR family transcriptional regulator [Amycolatopsis sp. CA-230715]QWF78566.1 hypothetical protein HUW46_01962 [Amycolatopsis sp. CA-230715]
MALAERADEFAILKSLAADAARGRGSSVVVCGPIASGKTELLNEFADHAVADGATLLTAIGSPAERCTPLGVFSQLVNSGSLTAEAAEHGKRLLAEGRDAAAARDPESEHVQHVRTQVVHELCSVVLEQSVRGPLLVVVDDIQHVDIPSLQCLLALVKRLRWAPAMLLLGETDQARDVNPLFHAGLLRQTHSHRIRLSPLSVDGVRAVLAERQDPAAANALDDDVHTITGGNPLLIRALLEDAASAHLSQGTRAGRGPVVGRAFGQAILSCLHRCDELTRDAARGVAVLGESGTAELIGELLGVEPRLAGHGLQRLTEAGLLDSSRFRHPAARTAVLGGLGAPERAALHRKAAELLHHHGVPAATVAEHVVKAGETGLPWAVPVLQRATEQALLDDQPELAARYLEHAHRLCTDQRTRASILTALAGVEWRVNPSASARRLGQLIPLMRDGLLDTTAATALLGHLLWHGRTEDATEVSGLLHEHATGTRALAEIGTARQWLSLSYPTVLGTTPPNPAIPQQSARPVPAVINADPNRRATAALHAVFTTGPTKDAVTSAEQVLQGTRLGDHTIAPIETALLTLIYADRVDKAAPWCELLQNEAAERRAPGWEAMLCSLRAEIAFRGGDMKLAETQAQLAFDHVSAPSWGPAIGLPLGNLVLALTAMGRYAEAGTLLNQPLPDSLLDSRFGLHFLYARGQYNLATNALYAALADFHTCGELMAEWRLDLPALIPWRSAAAEAYLRLGHRARAEKLATEQLARCGRRHSRTRGISLRVVATTSDLRQRPKLLREAEEELQACGDRLELARVLTELSAAYQALNEPSQVRLMARRAWHVAKDCRAEPLCQTLMPQHTEEPAREAARKPARTDRAKALTDAEWRVANLAALGHTNLEIAGKLYITVSTVEQHLTRVYRKLNVSRRTELPTGLHAELGDTATVR